MGLIDLIWNMHQQRRLDDTQSELRRGATTQETNKTQIDELQSAVNRLALVNRALWEIMSERLGVTEDELKARVEEIDLRDGVADGRMGHKVVNCPGCGHKNAGSRQSCLYCGMAL